MDVDLGQLREPCACGKAHNIDVEKISIESGAVRELTDILEAFQNPVDVYKRQHPGRNLTGAELESGSDEKTWSDDRRRNE